MWQDVPFARQRRAIIAPPPPPPRLDLCCPLCFCADHTLERVACLGCQFVSPDKGPVTRLPQITAPGNGPDIAPLATKMSLSPVLRPISRMLVASSPTVGATESLSPPSKTNGGKIQIPLIGSPRLV